MLEPELRALLVELDAAEAEAGQRDTDRRHAARVAVARATPSLREYLAQRAELERAAVLLRRLCDTAGFIRSHAHQSAIEDANDFLAALREPQHGQ